jgi:hypothetical protein
MSSPEQLKLTSVRIYREDKNLEATAGNLVIEVDGIKLNGVMELDYKVSASQPPTLTLKMMAHVDIDAGAMLNTTIVDPPGRIKNNMDVVKY